MQLIPATAQIGPLGAADAAPSADASASSDPANADAFRAALSAARESASETTTATTAASSPSDGRAVGPTDEAVADDAAQDTDDAPVATTDPLAAWLALLAPLATPAPTQPLTTQAIPTDGESLKALAAPTSAPATGTTTSATASAPSATTAPAASAQSTTITGIVAEGYAEQATPQPGQSSQSLAADNGTTRTTTAQAPTTNDQLATAQAAPLTGQATPSSAAEHAASRIDDLLARAVPPTTGTPAQAAAPPTATVATGQPSDARPAVAVTSITPTTTASTANNTAPTEPAVVAAAPSTGTTAATTAPARPAQAATTGTGTAPRTDAPITLDQSIFSLTSTPTDQQATTAPDAAATSASASSTAPTPTTTVNQPAANPASLTADALSPTPAPIAATPASQPPTVTNAAASASAATGAAIAATNAATAATWAALSTALGVQSVAVTDPSVSRPATTVTGPTTSTTGKGTPAAARNDDSATAGIAPADLAATVVGAVASGQLATMAGGQNPDQSDGQNLASQPDDTSVAGAGSVFTMRRTPAALGTTAPAESSAAAMGVAGIAGPQQATPLSQTQAQAASVTPLPFADQVAEGATLAARRIGQRVDVVIQPEGLGTVSLRVSVERAGLGIHITADNPAAREMIQASWPQLQQALDQRGLSVQSMFLDMATGQGSSEAFQTFQQFSGQQQFTGQQARGGSSTGTRRDDPSVSPPDEGARITTGGGATSRVDYRI